MIENIKRVWLFNFKADILAGIVVALALIPEAIAFSIIAGVDPMVGLYASFCITVVVAIMGGRPGMISAATGAMALLMVPLVKEHGVEYLFAATLLTGAIQAAFGVFKIARLMKFIPRAVMIGFVNSLAILIFMAQIPHFIRISNTTYIFVGATLLIVYLLPRFMNAIPAPLVAIVLLTGVAIYFKLDVRTVGDLGTITKSLPAFSVPAVAFTMDTLRIILPYSLALSIVGLLETLLTSTIVDDMTGTESNKNKEAVGQGVANFITGFFGGMAGCAMIGQSIINVKSGGRGRLSTLTAGVFLIFLIIVLGDLVVRIPMPVLVGIMIMVSIGTFDWRSFSYMLKAPKSDVAVMLSTVFIVVATHDLSKGVIAGVLLSSVFFVSKISKIKIIKQMEEDHTLYTIEGQLFFASVESFLKYFNFDIENQKVVIDFDNSQIWDGSAVGAIDKLILKYKVNNNVVILKNLNQASKKIMDSLAIHNDDHPNISSH